MSSRPEEIEALRPLMLEAGQVLRDGARRRKDFGVRSKSRPVDLVTSMDHRLQEMLVSGLMARYPTHHVVAEEGEASRADATGAVWYVDPLDGTTNFVHGYPFVALSMGCLVDGIARVGLVHAPMLDELFWAVRGHGAWMERPERGEPPVRLAGSGCDRLEEALLATGFPYHRGALARLNLTCVAHALHRCHGVRRAGSAALDLCYLAAGRLDGFWEMTLQPWDVAAAGLIAEEAGMRVTDFEGAGGYVHGRRVCAAPDVLHADLLALLAQAHAEPEHSPLGEALPGPIPLTPGDLDDEA